MRRAIMTAGATALLALPAIPASAAPAAGSDCRILGPEYVAEVVDCAVYIIERAVQW